MKGEARQTKLTDSQLERFRHKLLELRRDLLRDYINRNTNVLGTEEELRTHVGDEADMASQERRRDLERLMSEREMQRLREIEAALDRISDGRYGVCELTGEPIPIKRLEAVPTARFTVEALEELEEQRRLARERGIEEEDYEYSGYSRVQEQEGFFTEEMK